MGIIYVLIVMSFFFFCRTTCWWTWTWRRASRIQWRPRLQRRRCGARDIWSVDASENHPNRIADRMVVSCDFWLFLWWAKSWGVCIVTITCDWIHFPDVPFKPPEYINELILKIIRLRYFLSWTVSMFQCYYSWGEAWGKVELVSAIPCWA